MPDTQPAPPGFPPIRTEPVVVNVNTAKQGLLGGGLANRLFMNILTSWISSWLAYAVAATGLIPYALAFGLWWFGWTAKAPIPPGKQPPPAAIDPRVDELKLRIDDSDTRIKKLEQEIKEDRERHATDIERQRGENATLTAAVDRLEGEGREARNRASGLEAELRRESELHDAHSRDRRWLRMSLFNLELKSEIDRDGWHVNSQCPHCHVVIAMKWPHKNEITRCPKCLKDYSLIEAWVMGPPEKWKALMLKRPKG